MLHGDLSQSFSDSLGASFLKTCYCFHPMNAGLTDSSHCGGSKLSTDVDTLGFKLKIIL